MEDTDLRGTDPAPKPSGTPYRAAIRDVLIWVPVGAIPIGNGVVRMFGYGPYLGEPWASWVSGLMDCVLILLYAALLARPHNPWRRSLIWLACTTALHFALGGLVFGVPISALVGKYDVTAGESWLVVNAAILAAPHVHALLERRRRISRKP